MDLAQEDGDLRGLHVARPDRPWLYGLRPGADLRLREPREVRYRINADGFRDRIRSRPKPDGVFRILALGDSVTFGYGVEEDETYPMRLEASFAARSANSSGVSDSRSPKACDRLTGTLRRSSTVQTPARLGSPQDVRGAFQSGSCTAAAICSAGAARKSVWA